MPHRWPNKKDTVRCLTPIAAGFAPTVYTVPISRAKPLAAEAETKTTAILLRRKTIFIINDYYKNSGITVENSAFHAFMLKP